MIGGFVDGEEQEEKGEEAMGVKLTVEEILKKVEKKMNYNKILLIMKMQQLIEKKIYKKKLIKMLVKLML